MVRVKTQWKLGVNSRKLSVTFLSINSYSRHHSEASMRLLSHTERAGAAKARRKAWGVCWRRSKGLQFTQECTARRVSWNNAVSSSDLALGENEARFFPRLAVESMDQ